MKNRITVLLALVWVTYGMAQEEENIGTETVTVIKSYTPTISDAFKIKSSPSLSDSIILNKKTISYEINSVPVASTFEPAKGKAAQVEKAAPPTLYNSYASIALGNFSNALVEFFTSRELNRGEDLLDVGLNHFSSRGQIESTPLDTDFYDTELKVAFSKRLRDLTWGASLGAQHQLYNWYGLQSNFLSPTQVDAVTGNEAQNYLMGQAKLHVQLEDSFFKKAELLFRRFQDDFDSAENRLLLTPQFEFPITNEQITLHTKLDYLSGSFANSSLNDFESIGEVGYGRLLVGINPSLQILRDDLTIDLGANFVYGSDIENNEGNFYIYPAITASYRLMEEKAIAYGGIEGDLEQNTYHALVEGNPFVSPTLLIQPTDKQYQGYLGVKGQLLSKFNYNVKGSYVAENRVPLYLLNPLNTNRAGEGYAYGNSFQVFYDDIKTISVFGEVNVDVNRNFSLGLNAEYINYNTETDNPAWNLPEFQTSAFFDYQLGEQWFFGGNLFYLGERQDLRSEAEANVPPNQFSSEIITLEGFLDANAHLGYRLNDQLSVYARFNNIANNYYERWSNFRVQSFQAMAGATYKFDM